MSANAIKTWLVAYDIRCGKRLARVHRRLRKEGATLQYSAFTVQAREAELHVLLAQIERLIDTRVDDVRAYHLPPKCPVWTLGTQGLPEGCVIDGELAGRLLLDRAPVEEGSG